MTQTVEVKVQRFPAINGQVRITEGAGRGLQFGVSKIDDWYVIDFEFNKSAISSSQLFSFKLGYGLDMNYQYCRIVEDGGRVFFEVLTPVVTKTLTMSELRKVHSQQ